MDVARDKSIGSAKDLQLRSQQQPPTRQLDPDEDADGDEFYVQVAPFWFRLWWLGMVILHALCIGCFGLQHWAYYVLPDLYLGAALETYQVSMPLDDFHTISLCQGLIALLHSYLLLKMLAFSLWQRRFTFGSCLRPQKPRRAYATTGCIGKTITWIVRSGTDVFSRKGVLGIQGHYFELVYVAREVVETVLQSIQAYSMSQLVPSVSVNRFFVFVIVLNCWSTPMIQHKLAHDPPLVRLLCLVFDILLDFVSTVGIPMKLLVPYLRVYDIPSQNFDYLLWYNDKWLVNMIHELRLVFISSWAELVSHIIFSLSLVTCVGNVKSLLRPSSSPSAAIHPIAAPEAAQGPNISTTSCGSNSRTDSNGVKAIAGMKAEESLQRKRWAELVKRTRERVTKTVHVLMLLWGAIILLLHVRVSFNSTPANCMLLARPWFGTKSSCALLYVDCKTTAGGLGNATELDAAMRVLEERTLTHIVIRHCAQVEIPTRVQTFPKLVGFKIYNSTLVDWPSEAALTARHHRQIVFLFMIQVNMTQLPPGLLSDEFPKQLMDMEFSGTNLTSLPSDLDQIWPHGASVVFESSGLTSVPEAFKRLQVSYFSLVGNAITTLPEQVFTNPLAVTIWLNDNPIAELPRQLMPSSSIQVLHLSNTLLQTLPSWIDAAFFSHAYVAAGGSPLCRELLSAMQETTVPPANLGVAWAAYQAGNMDCEMYTGDDATYYPRVAEATLDA